MTQVRKQKRPRQDLTGAAFCGMLWATSAPPYPAWRRPSVGAVITVEGVFIWKGAIQSISQREPVVKSDWSQGYHPATSARSIHFQKVLPQFFYVVVPVGPDLVVNGFPKGHCASF